MPQTEPKWIDRFFLIAAVLFLTATVGALYTFWVRNSHPPGQPIADLTLNLGGQQVREHCTTCHPQGARPDPGRPGTAVREHPEIAPHLPEKLGCTGCHQGEGMALDVKISHGLPGLGARRVLTGREVQASCYRCHELAPLAGAEKAWQGYRLFLAKACNSCHHIAGLGQGGRFGPDLSRIGSQLGLEKLRQAIREPDAEPANSIMPRFPLSKGQVDKISYFLKSRVADPYYATPMEIQSGRVTLPEVTLAPAGRDLAAGERLLYERQCLACHQFGAEDGRIAPDLSYIGSLRDEAYLRDFLTRPSWRIPGSRMPTVALSDKERDGLTGFLHLQAIGPVALDSTMPGHAGHAGAEPGDPNLAGKQLYMVLCQRCHAAGGDGYGPIQPNLANFPRAFAGNAEFFRRTDQARLNTSVDKGIPGTSMPPYDRLLTAAERDSLLKLIFAAFIGIDPNDKAPPPDLPDRPPTSLTGETTAELFREHCVRCHGAVGTGTGKEALNHLPRPRNLTNRPYFAALDDGRIATAIHAGIPGTAMPAFAESLDVRQLWSLVDKVRTLSGTKP